MVFNPLPGYPQITNLEIFNQSYLTINVMNVLSLIRTYTEKPISINRIADFPDPRFQNFKGYFGIGTDKGDTIKIWISDDFPEQVLVHELLHVLLRFEGYPEIFRDLNYLKKYIGKTAANQNLIDNLQSVLSSTIDHQIIYPRMGSIAELRTEDYFETLVRAKTNRVNKKNKNSLRYKNIDVFYRQQDLNVLFDLQAFGPSSQLLIQKYSNTYPELYSYFQALNSFVQETGFSTPIVAKESAEKILSGIIEYGEKHNLDQRVNNLWRCLFVK